MTDTIHDLMEEYISLSFPIKRMRIDSTKHHKIKTKSNFKRVVKTPNKIYVISNNEQKYITMRSLSVILSRMFHVSKEDTTPLLIKHLHITKPLNKIQSID